MTKEQLIKKEYKKIHALYESLPSNLLQLAEPTIQNAAFMKITLDELQVAVNKDGCTEGYQNGERQSGRKQSSNLQAYTALMKQYTGTIDRLNKMLPAETKNSKLETFLKG